jgi:hypothetical protein
VERDIAELPTRPVGRPSHKPVVWYKGFLYQARELEDSTSGGGENGVPCWELFPRIGKRIENWSLVKTGGRLVKHARYYWLLWEQSHLTRRLLGSMVRRIALLPIATDRAIGSSQQRHPVDNRLG